MRGTLSIGTGRSIRIDSFPVQLIDGDAVSPTVSGLESFTFVAGIVSAVATLAIKLPGISSRTPVRSSPR